MAPDTPIRAAAERMSAAHVTSVVVPLAGGGLGIMTDHDLRTRVVAEGLSGDAPVSAAMSAPAYTCAPDRTAGEVLIEMADRGFRHLPVVSATGEVLGVIEDTDLLIARSPLLVLSAPADRRRPGHAASSRPSRRSWARW